MSRCLVNLNALQIGGITVEITVIPMTYNIMSKPNVCFLKPTQGKLEMRHF